MDARIEGAGASPAARSRVDKPVHSDELTRPSDAEPVDNTRNLPLFLRLTAKEVATKKSANCKFCVNEILNSAHVEFTAMPAEDRESKASGRCQFTVGRIGNPSHKHSVLGIFPSAGRLMSGMGEIGENAPSEANFTEITTIAETQDSIQVTADSGALSGLDKRVAQPGKGSTRKQGKAPRSATATGNPKPQGVVGVGRCVARSVR